ncbi:DNA-binding transcriptional repressor ArsR [Serratia fonticola]|uniref:DNA-binding transcriptional repressor ArsR n=1 Tax=Serratia fonticola TaxID=47917 RepID=A0A4U9TX54_SERFO|nr:DNA-binding transcriptional repressor ArsR [Serratia fonticola]
MTLTSLQLFKILSDETRLGIVLLLKQLGELCVCDLCTGLEESQPKDLAPLGNAKRVRVAAGS